MNFSFILINSFFYTTFEYYEPRNICDQKYIRKMAIQKDLLNRFSMAMFKIASALKKGMEDSCEKYGDLSVKEVVILNYIGDQQSCKMSDISESQSAPVSTVTSIVDRLVEKGYLTRYHSSEDRRVVLVTLGTKGKETYEGCIDKKQNYATVSLSQFEDADQIKLVDMLEKLAITHEEK